MPARLLIADDSPVMQSVMERAIRIADLPVSTFHRAGDGEAVLRTFAEHPIDFLLLDVHLPGIDGENLIVTLKERWPARQLPFMVASADASAARIERMLELGACDYLLKPFSISALCSRLGNALSTSYVPN
jgi:DNA-binding response OmpR family regulator